VFIRNVFLTLTTEFVTIGGSFLTGVLLARGLSVEDRGIMALVMAFPFTVASLFNLGLPQANIYLLGRGKFPAKTVLASALTAAFALGLLAFLGIFALRNFALATFLRDLPEEYFLLLLFLVPLLLVDGVLLSILRAHQRFDLFNLRRLANTLLLLAGFGAALFIHRGELNAVVWVYVGVTGFLVALNLFLTGKVVPISIGFNKQFTSSSFRFGLKSYLQNLFGALNYRLDIYLLAFFLNAEQVAYYAIAVSIVEVAWYIPNTVGLVLFPRLSNTPLEEIHNITARVCRSTVGATFVFVVIIGAAGWLLVPAIYGAPYQASILPLLILMPGVVFMAIYKVLTRNFTSRDRQQISILAAFLAMLVNIGLNWLLIPRFAVAGAAFASTLSYTLAGTLLLYFFSRETGIAWAQILLPKRSELAGHLKWARSELKGKWSRVRV
jgi:O-antigen/teichoic acid export membrane protein